MTRHQAVLFRQFLILVDVAVSAGAFVAALSLRQWLGNNQDSWVSEQFELPRFEVGDYYQLVWLLLPIWMVALSWTKASDFRVSYWRMFVRYARGVAAALAAFVVVAFLYHVAFVARSFVVLFGLVQLVALISMRIVLLESFAAIRRTDGDAHRVLVVGCSEHALGFVAALRRSSPWNNRLLGHVTVPGERVEEAAEPVLGDVDQLAALLDREAVDEVVFAVPGADPDRFRKAIAACDERGVDVLLTMPSMLPQTSGKIELAHVTGFDMPMLGMTRVPTSQGRLLLKRMLDIVGSGIGLILASPLLIAVAIGIKLTSTGPVFFKQVRAGRNGRKFTMLKFRSMVVNAEELKAKLAHLNQVTGPVFSIKGDPRITGIGGFIRKTSIDELPQLINVFFGDMSLVGPRPPLPSEVVQYEPWQRRRLSVKPGLTGPWQVAGRDNLDFERWMALDLDYIDNWSLWLDIKIILKTVPAVIRGSGAG